MVSKDKKAIAVAVMLMLLQACASTTKDSGLKIVTSSSKEVSEKDKNVDVNEDKFESFNRVSFAINNKLDDYVLRPMSVGYRAITTKYIRDMVGSALSNTKEPASFVANILKGDFLPAIKNIGRFGINTTLGLLGTHDVASKAFGLDPVPSGMDETLATWCVKDGPYIVLPILGSGTPRSFVGDAFDGMLNPVFIAASNDKNVYDKVLYPTMALTAVSKREANLELIDDFKKNSVDFYATARSAFLQSRGKINRCGISASEETEQSLDYDFDFDMDDGEED